MKKLTYVFDLDNTLCVTKNGFGPNGNYGPQYFDSTPIKARIERVNQLYNDGHTIIIDTARGNISGKDWFPKTFEQLKQWGIKFHKLRSGKKFSADVYVDDRGVNSNDFFDDYNLNKESGSGLQTNVLLVNRVVKEANDERVDKLIDEIQFVQNIPKKFAHRFPKIIFFKNEGHKAFYEMEHFDLPTIRRLILTGDIKPDEVVDWTQKINEFSMLMYNHARLDIHPSVVLQNLHWNRFSTRMKELKRKSIFFDQILSQEKVSINGVDLFNLDIIVNCLQKNEQCFYPEFVGRWAHGDLHFSNILIDRSNNNFILIDPRGYDYCEYYYDFGKIWHSVESKYELISDKMFTVSTPEESTHSFMIDRNAAWYILEESKQSIYKDFIRLSNESENEASLKIEFNNFMHFATLIPFLLDDDPALQRARVAYYESLILGNRLCQKWGFKP